MFANAYIFANDNKRVFINSSLGCKGQCSYCYLPMLGYNNKSIKKSISAKKIIELLEQNNLNINNNTLISLGCFSECWDENNKNETIDIIKYFLKNGTQIQLSTKCIQLRISSFNSIPVYSRIFGISKHKNNISGRIPPF